MRWNHPPPAVDAEKQFAVLAESIWAPGNRLQIVDVGLIVCKRLALLGQKLVGENCEEHALDEGEYAAEETTTVVRGAHVLLAVLGSEEHVERNGHQQTEVQTAQQAVYDELEEVFIVALSDTIVDPRAVVVHLQDLLEIGNTYLKDAGAALRAVVRTLWLPTHVTFLAALKHGRFDAVRYLNVLWDSAWV